MGQFSQFSGVTGVKKPSRYREIIEAGSEQLPAMMRRKEQKAESAAMFGLEKERAGLDRSRFRHEKKQAKRGLYEARKARKGAEKSKKISTGIGALGAAANILGGTAASGGGSWGLEPVGGAIKKAGKSLWGGVSNIFSGLGSLFG